MNSSSIHDVPPTQSLADDLMKGAEADDDLETIPTTPDRATSEAA